MSRKRDAGIDGVLVIDKPAGMTSHDVVDRIRKRFGTRRVGHAGTLDPDATGVLILGLGRATRFLSYAQASIKRYRTTAVLGVTTTTQDAAGEVVERRAVNVSEAQVRAVAAEHTGNLDQVPPMVSAVRVGGERLYKKARRGEEIERATRPVTIYQLEVLSFNEDPPEAVLDVRCSAGTYVRTLVHDIGASLGCGAHLRSLRRTEAGGFVETDAIELDAVEKEHLLPLADAVRDLPRIEIEDDAARLVANGRRLELPSADLVEDDHFALVNHGDLIAVYARRGDELVPERVVAPN
ncbi:MAG: tRNA pseudouridine(55) synthase TruB [Actinobacteria bacterium]|nr:tRNA pseudouridine(55) synthase TruB [Actinomycetota bacterium]